MNRTINTPCGKIKGTAGRQPGVIAFKGVRYATAGRWEYPQVIKQWDGIYDATRYGNCSFQPRAFYNEAEMPEKAFYYNEFRKDEVYTYSEDCLFLNVWTTETADENSKLPVIFYIHGGGFNGGCGHEKHFDGPVWRTKGVVAVTINYRMGPLGFACLEELAKESGHTGNYGIFDQIAALQWVRENISAFGGDPDNITIMGQSAGAMSVSSLCLTPLTNGMFAKAVMSSAGGTGEYFPVKATAEEVYPLWNMVMVDCGCETLRQFRQVPPQQLWDAWKAAQAKMGKAGFSTPLCVDGVLYPKSSPEIIAEGSFKNIPYMIGSTTHDIISPMLFKMMKDWCVIQADQGKQDSWCWMFDRMLPGDNNGAWHSSDLWYWFGTLDNCWRPFEKLDYQLSDIMTDYLCNFAKNGNPNGDNLPEWTATKTQADPVLHWGDAGVRMEQPDIEKLEEIFRTVKPVGE